MTITITRTEDSPDDLRRAARLSKSVAQARRLLAIALMLEGHSRTDAATAAGMDRQSLRDWVHGFNAQGPAGLVDKPRSGLHPGWLRCVCRRWMRSSRRVSMSRAMAS